MAGDGPKHRSVRFLLRRGLAALLLVFAVTSGALLLAELAPGDYAAQIGRSPAEIAAERARLGLDRPFLEQYTHWLRRSLTLDLVPGRTYAIPVSVAAGGTVKLSTSSPDFWDTIALLYGPDEDAFVGSDDDQAYFAAFDLIVPAGGTYMLHVTSFESVSTGDLVVKRS